MRCLWFFLLLLPATLIAQLRIISPIKEHMVLQRDKKITIIGVGEPGSNIRFQFDGLSLLTEVDQEGSWTIVLPPRNANGVPQDINLYSGKEHVVITDILIGDLWVCIGQSNMEWPMQKEMYYNDWKDYANPSMRFYNPSYAGKNIFNAPFSDSVLKRLNPERFYEGRWESCDPRSLASMSAVAFYFGKMLSDALRVPIGLINLSIGGAPLETFISKEALYAQSKFAPKLSDNWILNDALPVWIRERGMQNVGRLQNPPSDSYGPFHGFKPGFAFSSGIRPFSRIPIAGIINYQGESNAQELERVLEYNDLTEVMLRDFRNNWNDPSLPYYYVQLSSIDTLKYKGHLWTLFRDQQRLFLGKDKFSGMAVSSDIGARNDVHPTNKKLVGERLALQALDKKYKKKIVSSGPLPLKAMYRKGVLRIQFLHAVNGLTTVGNEAVHGFSLDGIQEVPATISGSEILIQTSKKPAFVYYGWKSFSDGNLINKDGLPASTFKMKIK